MQHGWSLLHCQFDKAAWMVMQTGEIGGSGNKCLNVERAVDEVGVASLTLSAPSPRRLVWLSRCNP